MSIKLSAAADDLALGVLSFLENPNIKPRARSMHVARLLALRNTAVLSKELLSQVNSWIKGNRKACANVKPLAMKQIWHELDMIDSSAGVIFESDEESESEEESEDEEDSEDESEEDSEDESEEDSESEDEEESESEDEEESESEDEDEDEDDDESDVESDDDFESDDE